MMEENQEFLEDCAVAAQELAYQLASRRKGIMPTLNELEAAVKLIRENVDNGTMKFTAKGFKFKVGWAAPMTAPEREVDI